MSVYVDEAVWEWRGKKWCHLLADSLDELHAFAAKLGMQRAWFQSEGRYPHYDLTENKRTVALDLGAIAIDRRKTIEVARKLREEFLRPPPQSSLF